MLIYVVFVIYVICLVLLETSNNPWDFELLDTGNGYRLEQWGDILLARPDPQIIWKKGTPKLWEKISAKFIAGKGEERGRWEIKGKIPDPWIVNFDGIHPVKSAGGGTAPQSFNGVKFLLKLSPFKHTGLFAEQAAQWEWMLNRLEMLDTRLKMGAKNPMQKANNLSPRILNLFAYTGGATMVLAKAGCQVTHVDASKPAITWANENHKLNNLPADSVRWILDDAVKFVKRELKRGAKYDGIIMDPPAFGHSPTGKTWKFNDDLPGLLADCVQLLSDDAKFLIINGYATNSSAVAINNLLEDAMRSTPGKIEFGELCLKQKSGRMISTGIFSRWSSLST